jgi:putative endonuclease
MSNKAPATWEKTLARDFFEKQGYRILGTNYRCSGSEINIVTRHGDFLVFVEVRTRASLDYCNPEESHTPGKEGRLIATAQYYRQGHNICQSRGALILSA